MPYGEGREMIPCSKLTMDSDRYGDPHVVFA